MTEEVRNAAIGALVVEYEENERRIATLKSLLYKIGTDLELLGRELQRVPTEVKATDAEFRFRLHSAVPCASVSSNDLRDHLEPVSKGAKHAFACYEAKAPNIVKLEV